MFLNDLFLALFWPSVIILTASMVGAVVYWSGKE